MHKMFSFKCRNNFQIFNKAENLQNQLASAIEDKKQKCNSRISKMLMDPLTSVKTCWTILKIYLNDKNTPSILTLFYQNILIYHRL